MNELKSHLINKARERYRSIYPCHPKEDINECFTVEENKLLLWFNTEDNSTHLVSRELS